MRQATTPQPRSSGTCGKPRKARLLDPFATVLIIAVYGATPERSSYAEVPMRSAIQCYYVAPLVREDAERKIATAPDWKGDTVWVGCGRPEFP